MRAGDGRGFLNWRKAAGVSLALCLHLSWFCRCRYVVANVFSLRLLTPHLSVALTLFSFSCFSSLLLLLLLPVADLGRKTGASHLLFGIFRHRWLVLHLLL